MKMTLKEIETYADKFLKEAYGMDLEIPVEINGRLSRFLGRFIYSGTLKRPIRIEISKKYLINGSLNDILSTIRHECIHYALFCKGLPFRDGEKYFESELKKHDTHSTNTVTYKSKRNVNVYSCECKEEHITLRALSDKGMYHRCRKCKNYLKYEGKKLMEV